MNSLEPNSEFAGRYRIIRCIAAGGMGAVYEAIHLETQRKRALKTMHAHFVQSAELRDRFKQEARVAAQIDSEFIVDVFDAGIDEATQMPFLVMELLKGEELGKRLERVGHFAPAEVVTYLWQTALALDKTHKANIVHRDLKPENLFLTQREDGPPRVKVLDFGVAKFVAETSTQAAATRSLGTPLYMSPEQFLARKVTPASDNYALALMAYTLLIGAPYWDQEASGNIEIVAFAMKASAGPVDPASQRAARAGKTLPAAFDTWFSKATACDPLMRYSSATESIRALGQVFGLDPTRMTGFGSSDPLPQLQAARTQPLGTGVQSTGPVGAAGYPSTPNFNPGGGNFNPGGGNANTGPGNFSASGARLSSPSGTALGVPMEGAMNGTSGGAVAFPTGSVPTKKSPVAAYLIGAVLLGGAGGGYAYYRSLPPSGGAAGNGASTSAQATSGGAAASPATSAVTPSKPDTAAPPGPASAAAAASASVSAAPSASASAAPSAEPTKVPTSEKHIELIMKPQLPQTATPPPQVTRPPTPPRSSGAYSQD